MSDVPKCALCGSLSVKEEAREALKSRSRIKCISCGRYWLSDMARHPSAEISGRLYLLSGLCRNQTDKGNEPIDISSAMVASPDEFERDFASRTPRDIHGKAMAILRHIGRRSEYPGHRVWVSPRNDYPVGFCHSEAEFHFYLLHLQENGALQLYLNLMDASSGSFPLCITAKGWDELSGNVNIEPSDQCFVAMWFDDSMIEVFSSAICGGIVAAGYKPIRIDNKEHNNRIDDEIVAEIRNSKFSVADFTGQRGGVYFEAGFALGLGRSVIWLCRKDEMEKLHFDTRQYNFIIWELDKLKDLALAIERRIIATIGRGNYTMQEMGSKGGPEKVSEKESDL